MAAGLRSRQQIFGPGPAVTSGQDRLRRLSCIDAAESDRRPPSTDGMIHPSESEIKHLIYFYGSGDKTESSNENTEVRKNTAGPPQEELLVLVLEHLSKEKSKIFTKKTFLCNKSFSLNPLDSDFLNHKFMLVSLNLM